jgi:hypothetical protein
MFLSERGVRVPVQDQNAPGVGVGEVRPTSAEDLKFIAEHMREADLMELRAAGKSDPLAVLAECYERTEKPLTGLWNGTPCCVFGIARINYRSFYGNRGRKGMGAPWLLGTDRVAEARWKFLRENRPVLWTLESEYDILWNQVHAKNLVHIRWLKWLGFDFGETINHPATGEPFINFGKVIL